MTIEIHLESLSFKCPKCHNNVFLKNPFEMTGYSRKHSFHDNKGEVRCDSCGYKINYKFAGDLTLEIESKGLSCGVCGEVVKKLYDAYFCKDDYIKHLKEEQARYLESVHEVDEKLKKLIVDEPKWIKKAKRLMKQAEKENNHGT